MIVGCGNIGSNAALALARMGLHLFTLHDFDEVEEHNLASQAYQATDVGRKKVDAIKSAMLGINPDVRVDVVDAAFAGDAELSDADILISAVDSVYERRRICDGLIRRGSRPFVVDGRMGGGQVEVYSLPVQAWRDTIPDTAGDDPCAARYISYTSYLIAGMIANQVKRHLSGQTVKPIIIFHADTYQLLTPDLQHDSGTIQEN